MFEDVCLRADTEAELKDALGFAVSGGEWKTHSMGEYDLDVIGPLVSVQAVYGAADPETGAVPLISPPVWAGFHANLRLVNGFAPAIAPEFIIAPATPVRGFA